jgi:hypothetical protein
MAQIKFSYNWNNKLNNISFTTIRLKQPDKYVLGQVYEIFLNKDFKMNARIIGIINFFLKDLNEYMAQIDTGYSKEEATKIITKMYPNVDFESQQFSFILLRNIENEKP